MQKKETATYLPNSETSQKIGANKFFLTMALYAFDL